MIMNNDNLVDMEKEQLKAALKAIAKEYNISASDMAKEAGISPSTITGFLNDVPGRGHYGLSAKTQNKLSEKYPEFKDYVDRPPTVQKQSDVAVIGVWGADYRVTGLELGMSNSFVVAFDNEIQGYVAVLRNDTFFMKNFKNQSKGDRKNFFKEYRYYLFKNTYEDELDVLIGKQAYCTCENGTYLGWVGRFKDHFHLFDFFGNEIKSAGCVLKATKIEWTRQI